ncbi:MAG: DUF502 domain-containing protein [Clostridia bacterium]|nr:DUF502 domain-containing protein [Clostridia bacterium]
MPKDQFKKHYVNTFLAGLSAILPISITIYVFVKAFLFVDGILSTVIKQLFGKRIVGLGFLITIVLVYGAGLLVKQYLGNRLIALFEKVIAKIPYAQIVYNATRDISNSVFKKEKVAFKKPVLVDFPRKGTQSIGFISNDNVMIDGEHMLAVFVPTTPNPTSGFMIFVSPEEVKYLNITVEEATKMVISLGVLAPNEIK